jgi:hypothetical protein
MKKKVLVAALIAGLGAVGSAQAVFVNPDGLGQVLIYPYYTVQGDDGNVTNIHVVNTTTQVKAVKVRFLEAMNSREVIDFNLYLSPKDEWTGAVVRTSTGAKLVTNDTSCTVPNIPKGVDGGVAFRATEFAGDSVNGLARTREGYLEIIEMGVVTDATRAAAATHTSANNPQTPSNCTTLTSSWQAGGFWSVNAAAGMSAPTGGLYGYGTVLNINDGTDVTYDAIALDSFSALVNHTEPGSILPSLGDVSPAIATVFNGGVATDYTIQVGRPTVDAVSMLFMHNAIANDYVIDPTINAGTDWVVNFPTKRFYVNGVGAPFAPFSDAWDTTTSMSCDEIGFNLFDREEKTTVADLDFSPQPAAGVNAFCWEANVVTMSESNVLQAEFANNNLPLPSGFNEGWLQIGFSGLLPATDLTNGGVPVNFNGLPVVGFSAIQFTNGNVGGLLSNYAGNVTHKATRLVTP